MNTSGKMMSLEQIAKIYSGVGQKTPKTAFGDGGCPWVMVEDLQNTAVEKTSRHLTIEGMRAAKVCPPGTVFFSSTGTIGKVGIATGNMAPSNNIIAVEFDSDQVYPLYGMYCLAAMRSEFVAEARGAVYDSLRLTTFRKFQIPVPSINYQKLIANKLKSIQESILLQNTIIETMKQTVHTVFDNLFGRAVDEVMKQKTDLRLKDFADILLNGASKKAQNNSKRLRYISTSMLGDWEILCDQAPIVDVDLSTSERFQLQTGDIVMNRINSLDRLGHCGLIVDDPQDVTVFGQNTLRLRISSAFNPFFMFVWLTHPFVKQYIRDNCKNSTSFQTSLNKQAVLDIPLPKIDMERQEAFAIELEKYLKYSRLANQIVAKQQELQNIWCDKIRLLRNKDAISNLADQIAYRDKQYWTTPSGMDCYYDTYLECIQVPVRERNTLFLSQLPQLIDIQFLDSTRNANDFAYGSLEHIRLHRIDAHSARVIWMQPVAYRSDKDDSTGNADQALEDSDMLSEQQDFGYLRHSQEFEFHDNQTVMSLLNKPSPYHEKAYTRFDKLPAKARYFVQQMSAFQQAIYEEFLLALQPLACHMIRKQIMLRLEQNVFSGYSIQDVIATVRLLENTGLIERRQGFNLNYYKTYAQGEERMVMQDHRGQPIAMDTWVWSAPKGREIYATD